MNKPHKISLKIESFLSRLRYRLGCGVDGGSEGALLIATGERHLHEACLAVSRIRPYLGGRPLWLVCDLPEAVPRGLFDVVHVHPDPKRSYRDKIGPLKKLPFQRTLFLDTDLELLAPVDDIFTLLRSVDLVGCHAPVRWAQWQDLDVPEGFCELNSGVLGLRRNRQINHLVSNWQKLYDEVDVPFDQATLRSALWKACKRGLRVWILPPEYNLRTTKPWIAGQGIKVKIVHGRIPEAMRAPLKTYLNERTDCFRASSAFPTGQNAKVLEAHGVGTFVAERIFVLGAGRSGTSLLAGLFRSSGLFMGAQAYKSREANPHGFYEDREVNGINEALIASLLPAASAAERPAAGQHWLARLPLEAHQMLQADTASKDRINGLYAQGPSCFKDPRFCYTLQVWRDLLPTSQQEEARFLCVFRDPASVLASVLKELHDAPYLRSLVISVDQILACWCLQYRHVLERHSRSGSWLFVAYPQLFTAAGLDRIEAFTGRRLDRSLPDKQLNRSRPLQAVSAEAVALYQQLCGLAQFDQAVSAASTQTDP